MKYLYEINNTTAATTISSPILVNRFVFFRKKLAGINAVNANGMIKLNIA
jgi:hypothetical protein